MSVQQHIIDRQVLEIELPSADNAWQFQNRISDLYKLELLPMLDDVFSSMVGLDELIRIDKLEIDLGEVSAESLEQLLRERFEAKVRERISEVIHRSGNGTGNADNEERADIKEAGTSRVEAFIFFLETGCLPWWYVKQAGIGMEELVNGLITERPAKLKQALVKLSDGTSISLSSPGFKRLVYTFSPSVLSRLIGIFNSHTAAIALQNFEWLAANASGRGSSPGYSGAVAIDVSWKIRFWHAAFEVAMGNTGSSRKVMHEVMRLPLSAMETYAGRMPGAAFALFRQALTALVVAQGYEKLVVFAASDAGRKMMNEFEALKEIMGLVSDAKNEAVQGTETTTLNDKPAPEQQETRSEKYGNLADVYVTNAGLVLLWPFLQVFFSELGLVKEKNFVSEQARHRAVHLLQYLVTGGEKSEEHDLVLNKLMCGLQVAEPVEMKFSITEKERNECNNLLNAVIDNWKTIGRTSVDGFRNTFLIKEGALKKAAHGWGLFIERKTVDMLLDRLPWGISIVKLPWSREMIYVEW